MESISISQIDSKLSNIQPTYKAHTCENYSFLGK